MKKFLFLMVLAALSMSVSAFAAADHVFTVHHIGSMTHPYQKGAEHFKEVLEKYSDGKMTLDIFGSNQLAAGAKAVEGTQLGTIDIFVENPMSVSNVVPSFEALNL